VVSNVSLWEKRPVTWDAETMTIAGAPAALEATLKKKKA